MKRMSLILFAAIGITGVWVGATSAMPVNNTTQRGEGTLQHARLICDRFQQCYHPRHDRASCYGTRNPYEQLGYWGRPRDQVPSGWERFQQNEARRNMLN